MKKIFSTVRNEIEKYDNLREEVIKQSRNLLKASKLLIYSIHRNTDVTKNHKDVQQERKKLDIIAKKSPRLKYEGSYSDAMQEYCEAVAYYEFFKTKKLLDFKKLKISENDYLMGICDLTGELGRKAVMNVIEKKYDEINEIRNFVDEIFKEFLKFNLRNGHLRKKADAIKWNLKKIEEVLYDVETKL